jgi:hypothetical protein
MILSLVDSIVPPPDADPKAVLAHRWRVSIAAYLALAGLIYFAVVSLGGIPAFFSGFATAQQVTEFKGSVDTQIQELKNTITSEEESRLDQQIFELRRLDCIAPNDAEKILYIGRIRDLMNRYYRVSGIEYNLPACADF